MLPDGLNWLCYFAGSSKSHRENSISCIFLESPYQVNMKSIVKCWKDFLWYFATLKTYRACPFHISIIWIYFLKNSLVLGTFLLHFAGGILSNRSCHKRLTRQGVSRIAEASQNTVGNLTNFRKRIVIIIAMHFFLAVLKPHVSLTKEIIWLLTHPLLKHLSKSVNETYVRLKLLYI